MNPDEHVHVEEVQDIISDLEERVEDIESDDRYKKGEDAADVQVNAYLALMQTEWSGELKGLKRALNALYDIA